MGLPDTASDGTWGNKLWVDMYGDVWPLRHALFGVPRHIFFS